MEKDKTLYVCLRCKYSCSNKFNFKKHLLKKNVCDSLYRDFDVFFLIDKLDEGDYISFYKKCIKQTKCDYCSSFYSSKSNMIRHRNVCPNNPKNLKEILNLVKKSDNNDTQLEKSACVESGAQIQKIENQSIDTQNNIQNQNIETQNNIQTQNNQQNIHIHINAAGNESIDVKNIYKLLSFDTNSDHFHREDDIYNLSKRVINYIDNYNIIFDQVYNNPENQNFKIINKRNKQCKIKSDEKNIKHINFEELSSTVFAIIDNIYNLSIKEFELNNDTESLYHYREFRNVIKERYDKFMLRYKKSKGIDKNMYYDVLYKFYKGFKDILKNNEEKIFNKSSDIKIKI